MVTRRIAGTTMANPIILVATIAWRSLVSLGLWIPKKNPIDLVDLRHSFFKTKLIVSLF